MSAIAESSPAASHTHHHHEDHHVHFSTESDEMKENSIVVRKRGETSFEVQLGFLQVNHTYEVCVDLSSSDLDPSLDLESYGQKEVPVPVHVKFLDLRKGESGASLTFVFKALHDKVTKEKMFLASKEEDELQFEIVARVLGKGKGTPLLRSGIHCISVEPSDETEDTDWKGF
eukprot:TRINITY_DN24582_c0_g1_i1.p1 TRINITY_DN24582_c0_g1~~TRINITY_DN24582_c0_g1_i1.p1  ORF type:complete len:173 (-),score=34.62 TRINITY_DN24582_c0_g1_i1:114-632(-)